MDLSQFSNADFDRGASVVKEALWIAVKALFFLPAWPLPSRFRVWLLRRFGARVGQGVVIRSRVNITFPWRVGIGDHVWLGEEVLIVSLAPVIIESNVCISQRAFLCTGSHNRHRADFALITKPIHVRAGSWIAAQAFIGPGVEIGSGAVVSAGSVVMENIPAESLARGNPAQVSGLVVLSVPARKLPPLVVC